jgi:hypothetical protein
LIERQHGVRLAGWLAGVYQSKCLSPPT